MKQLAEFPWKETNLILGEALTGLAMFLILSYPSNVHNDLLLDGIL